MKQYFVALVALGFLGTACKERQFNGAGAQSAQGGSLKLSGKNLELTCVDGNETMKANSEAPITQLGEKVNAAVYMTPGNSHAGKIAAFDENGYWRVEVKFNFGSFFGSWVNATFDKQTLKSLDGSTGFFPDRTQPHLANCELKIGSAGTGSIPEGIATPHPGTGSIHEGVAPAAAKYKCLTHESTQTFLTRESCARSGCPEQDCIRAQ
jgi:hypothetical protein